MDNVTQAKVGERIESAKRDINGRPIWILTKTGELRFSVRCAQL
jgi:hypothetical protein